MAKNDFLMPEKKEVIQLTKVVNMQLGSILEGLPASFRGGCVKVSDYMKFSSFDVSIASGGF